MDFDKTTGEPSKYETIIQKSNTCDNINKLEVQSDDTNERCAEEEKSTKMYATGHIKKFDQKLCDKYDIPARNKIKEILGEYIIDNPDLYGADMILNIPECRYKYIELQVCTTWIGEKFPHQLPFIYERKIKYENDTLFLVFDKNLKKGLLFSRKYVTDKKKRLKKYSREFIYEVRWNYVMPIYMETFDKNELLKY